MSTLWRNRIVRYSEEAPETLLANPKNWRAHPDNQAEALRGVLQDVGLVQNVIVNQRSGFLIDGHLRVALAIKNGQPTIPVTWVDLDESEEALVLASFDPLSAMADTNEAQLAALLHDVSSDTPALQQMLDELATGAGIVPGIGAAGGGGDEFDTTPHDGPSRTQAGDLWLIGGVHRLLVGDCTDPANVARLMDGERVECVFTSPPYDQQRTYEGNMAADWRALVSGAMLQLVPHCEDDAQFFVNLGLIHRDGRVVRYWDGLIDDLEAADWPLFGWYVWDKLNGMPGEWNGRLAPAHEWIFHFCRESLRPRKTIKTKGGYRKNATQRSPDGSLKKFTQADAPVQPFKIPDSVVRAARATNGQSYGDHPAPFPLALPEVFTAAYDGDLWVDPFLGSGTTLIAAHRAGRHCYGFEITPKYADVILRRAEAEGLTVEKEGSSLHIQDIQKQEFVAS